MEKKWRAHARQDSDLAAHLRALRGLSAADLTLSWLTGLHDPNLLPDMKAARALIQKAVREKWPVTIFGDYDADGTPAAALLSVVLTRLGLAHQIIIPTRAAGYGLKMADVEAMSQTAKVLITVDTGVAAVEEITRAKKLGLHVIVLDHHLPKTTLPPADAVIDPFVPGSTYPFTGLCGCALAYKFAEALAADFPDQLTEGFCKWLLDLVAISTVADMMPMQGENRVLVHYGLQVLAKNRRPGVAALLQTAGLDPLKLSAGNLGFSIGPRLNATGRLGDNRPALDLLLAPTLAAALPLAATVEQSNRERQTLVQTVLAEAEAELWRQNQPSDHLHVVVGDAWPAGVVGLVAGKLAAAHFRPTIVLTGSGDELTGSARSVADYSLIDALDSQQEYLARFGGHRQAAGLTVPRANLPKLVDGLKKHAANHLPASQLIPTVTADAILTDDELTLATAELCEKLQPFGIGNPAPSFVIERVTLGAPRFIGKDARHVKYSATKNGQPLDVIGFGLAAQAKTTPLDRTHLLGQLEKNQWNNQEKLQLKLTDWIAADQPIEII